MYTSLFTLQFDFYWNDWILDLQSQQLHWDDLILKITLGGWLITIWEQNSKYKKFSRWRNLALI